MTNESNSESRREHHDRERREAEELAEHLSLLGLETLIERSVERGLGAALAKLEELHVTLQAINDSLAAIENVENTLSAALTTIAANITTLQQELANAGADGITAADAQALADRAAADATALQTIADTVAQVAAQ